MRVNTCVCTCVRVSACECVCVRACVHGARSPACVPQTLYLAPSQGTSRRGGGLWPLASFARPSGTPPCLWGCHGAPSPSPRMPNAGRDLGPPLLWVGGGPRPGAPAPRRAEPHLPRLRGGQERAMLQSLEPRSGQECHTFTMAVPQGAGKRNWVLEVEVYSKDGRGRKDQYSSWSGEWVAGRTWVSEEGGGRARVAAPGKRKSGAGSRGRHRQPPRHPPALRSAAGDPQSLSLRPTRPSSVLLQPGHWKVPFVRFFFFFSSDTLIWDVWQKKKPRPHACCPAKMKVQGLVQTITFLKSYLQKEKFP